MPLPSPVDAPACFTAWRKPSTASGFAFAMISSSTSSASCSVSRAMTKPLRPNLTRSPRPAARAEARTSVRCSSKPAKSLPLEKYQSVTRPPISRASVLLPPMKISGCARPGTSTGGGFSVKSWIR